MADDGRERIPGLCRYLYMIPVPVHRYYVYNLYMIPVPVHIYYVYTNTHRSVSQKSIFHPSMFGSSLDDVMLLQKDHFPERRLPWIQTTLSEEVLRMSGTLTEGIFR